MRNFNWTIAVAFMLIFLSTGSCFTLSCNFIHDGWDSAVPTVYKCEVKPASLNLTARENSAITKIDGRPSAGVDAIRIYEQICNFFPQQLEKFFKNIQAIAVQNSKLKDLTKNDLRVFTNLKSLSLYGNELTMLEFGIFDGNLKLEFLSIYNNKISSVGSEILSPLKKLKKAFFHTNACVNFDALSEDEMKVLKTKLTRDCPPTLELRKLKENQEKLEKFEEDFEKLSLKFSGVKSELKNLEEINENLTRKAENSTCKRNEICGFKLSKCDAKLQDLLTTVTKFEIECETFNFGQCRADDVITFYEGMEVKSVKLNGTILDPSMVTTLEISGRNFHFMPMNFWIFKNLENLTIANTKISKVENFSANLTALKLSNNRIEKIQEIFIESLETLDLSYNKLESLPEIFKNLPNLRELFLDFNEISILRWKIFSRNSKLETLSIRGNKLRQIGSNLEAIGAIKCVVEDEWDEIWKIDESEGNHEMTTMRMNEEFYGETTTMRARELIKDTHPSLSKINLKILDLTDNFCISSQFPTFSLTSMVKDFSVDCIIWIEFEENSLETYNARDVEVDAENTKIYENFTSNSTVFTSYDQSLEFVPRNLQEIFPNLTAVDISRSKLRKIRKFVGLTKIFITKNDVKKLSDGNFDQSPKVEVIELSYNKISNLPSEIFAKLLNLKILNLNGNHLKTLSHEIIPKSNKISEFHCAFNQLEEIEPEIVKRLKNANLIDFNGNSCVDNKFKKEEHNVKKIMEIYGEIVFRCSV